LHATQGSSWGYLKVNCLGTLSFFDDKCPQNGSKNDLVAPRTILECPHEGPSVVTSRKRSSKPPELNLWGYSCILSSIRWACPRRYYPQFGGLILVDYPRRICYDVCSFEPWCGALKSVFILSLSVSSLTIHNRLCSTHAHTQAHTHTHQTRSSRPRSFVHHFLPHALSLEIQLRNVRAYISLQRT